MTRSIAPLCASEHVLLWCTPILPYEEKHKYVGVDPGRIVLILLMCWAPEFVEPLNTVSFPFFLSWYWKTFADFIVGGTMRPGQILILLSHWIVRDSWIRQVTSGLETSEKWVGAKVEAQEVRRTSAAVDLLGYLTGKSGRKTDLSAAVVIEIQAHSAYQYIPVISGKDRTLAAVVDPVRKLSP